LTVRQLDPPDLRDLFDKIRRIWQGGDDLARKALGGTIEVLLERMELKGGRPSSPAGNEPGGPQRPGGRVSPSPRAASMRARLR